ncbi:MAG: hypothetical protein GY928_34180 [Colwellia sp.]|nr:hypothetical protein [Colwellia sp.]
MSELEQKPEPKKPQQLTEIDIAPLREVCQQYIDDLEEHGYADEDFDYYIYEAAITMFFGKDVWQWINHRGSQ